MADLLSGPLGPCQPAPWAARALPTRSVGRSGPANPLRGPLGPWLDLTDRCRSAKFPGVGARGASAVHPSPDLLSSSHLPAQGEVRTSAGGTTTRTVP